MKVIITENRIFNTIENYLIKNYPGINRVRIETYPVGTYENGRYQTKDKVRITIVYNEDTIPDSFSGAMELKWGIKRDIKSIFGISDPNILFYHLVLDQF
jgi:hypothetical protein